MSKEEKVFTQGMYFNKAIIYGNLTRDPEMKALPSGASVTTFSLATNRVYSDKDGQKQEQTDYHNIVVFGRQAETVNQYLKKGSGALVEGRIQTRSWDADDGSKRYRTEIVADRIQFGPRSVSGSDTKAEVPQKQELKTIEYPTEEIDVDSIPF